MLRRVTKTTASHSGIGIKWFVFMLNSSLCGLSHFEVKDKVLFNTLESISPQTDAEARK